MKRAAVWREGDVGAAHLAGSPQGTWHCYHDDQHLLTVGGGHAHPQPDLVLLPHKVDGLPTYGLPIRTRILGKSTRGGKSEHDEAYPPIYAYCPRPGCGRGQRIG